MTPRRAINMLWIGSDIARIEKLSVAPFLTSGHPVHLHACRVHAEAAMRAANAVVSRDVVIARRHPKTGGDALTCPQARPFRPRRDGGCIDRQVGLRSSVDEKVREFKSIEPPVDSPTAEL